MNKNRGESNLENEIFIEFSGEPNNNLKRGNNNNNNINNINSIHSNLNRQTGQKDKHTERQNRHGELYCGFFNRS